jgi:hypothetical protein
MGRSPMYARAVVTADSWEGPGFQLGCGSPDLCSCWPGIMQQPSLPHLAIWPESEWPSPGVVWGRCAPAVCLQLGLVVVSKPAGLLAAVASDMYESPH